MAPPTIGPNTAEKKVSTATLDCSAVLGMIMNGTCTFVRTTNRAVPIPIATTSLMPNFSFMVSFLLVPHKCMPGRECRCTPSLSCVMLPINYIRFPLILQCQINRRLDGCGRMCSFLIHTILNNKKNRERVKTHSLQKFNFLIV